LLAGANCASTATGWYKLDSLPKTCSDCSSHAPPATEPGTTVASGVNINGSVSSNGNGLFGNSHFSFGF
ncbi:MAG: hypothetical protein RSD42_02595, partial [Oscillospiraceae bacterium]